MAHYAGINLSIIALLSDLSIIEHNSTIFGHNDSINMIVVYTTCLNRLRIIKLKHGFNFDLYNLGVHITDILLISL